MGFIKKLEFKQSGFPDELFGSLGICDSGKLNKNTVFALHADIGFAYAELINTVSYGFKRLCCCQLLDSYRFPFQEDP